MIIPKAILYFWRLCFAFNRAELKVTHLRWRSPICGFLRFSAKIFDFLRKSAVFCGFLRPPNAGISRRKGESAKICGFLRKSAVSAKICVLGSPCLTSVRSGPHPRVPNRGRFYCIFPSVLKLRLVFAPLAPSLRQPQWQHSGPSH